MAWERRRGGLYYYRSRREGGRVVKEYLGTGAVGVLSAELDDERRAEREAARARERAERERWAELERRARELDDLADLLTAATLLAAGYHRHDRGEWRRHRG